MSNFPLGSRGSFPCRFSDVDSDLAYHLIRTFPGVIGNWRRGEIRTTWDAGRIVAELTGKSEQFEARLSALQQSLHVDALMSSSALFEATWGKLRNYQREDVLWMLRRSWLLHAGPMRSGKTLTALMAAQCVDAKHILVVCPALAKLVWADEIDKWFQEQTYILYGRKANKGRRYNPIVTKTKAGKAAPKRYDYDEACLSNLAAHKWVVVNYDLLIPHRTSDARGVKYIREDLPGWQSVLKPLVDSQHFDLIIVDECHKLRGWDSAVSKTFRNTFKSAPRVWGLTGTPIYGYTRDLVGQLEALSGGQWFNRSRAGDAVPFSFHARYCEGQKVDIEGASRSVWKADGSTNEQELAARLKLHMLKRKRSDILKELPKKQRQVVRIEEDGFAHRLGQGSRIKRRTQAMEQTLKIKLPYVIDQVTDEMLQDEGSKTIVYTKLRKSAEKIADKLKKRVKSKRNGAPLRNKCAKVFSCHGGMSSEARFALSKSFREHEGAAVWVSTIDAVPGMISLNGATSVHFVELHDDPEACAQAEDRPYEVGTTGLTIVYYVVRDSYDEHAVDILLPKIEAIAEVLDSDEAKHAKETLTDRSKLSSFEDALDDWFADEEEL